MAAEATVAEVAAATAEEIDAVAADTETEIGRISPSVIL